MKTRILYIPLVISLVYSLTSCAGLLNRIEERKAIRKKMIRQGYEEIKRLAHSGLYEFEGTQAFPVGMASVDITNTANYFVVNYYDVEAYLPYFGVRHMMSRSDEPGLWIKGKLEDIIIEESDSRRQVQVRFKVKSKSEIFLVNLNISPDRSASLSVSSSKRSAITYRGEVSPIEITEEEKEEKEEKE